MSATITTTLKDNSKEWADTLKKRFDETGKAATAAGDKLSQAVGDELDRRNAKAFSDEVKRLADELENAERAASEQGKAQAKLNEYLNQTTRSVISQKRGLLELDAQAVKTATAAGKLADYSKDLSDALDAKKVAAYKKQVDELADSMVNGSKKAASFSATWTELHSKFAIVKQGFETVKWAATGAMGMISVMSEAGVPAFQRLTSAGEKVREALIKIGESDEVQDRVDAIATVIEKKGVPALMRWHDWFRDMFLGSESEKQLASAKSYIDIMERLGKLTKEQADERRKEKGIVEDPEDVAKKAKRQAERDARDEELKQQKKDAIQAFGDPGQKMREDEAQAHKIASMRIVADIEKRIGKEKEEQALRIAKIRDATGDGQNVADLIAKNRAVAESQKLLVSLEQRRLELITARRDQEKQAADEAIDKNLRRQQAEIIAETTLRDLQKEEEKMAKAGVPAEMNKKLLQLKEQLKREEDEYLATLEGPVKDQEEKRIARARELRDLNALMTAEQLVQIDAVAAAEARKREAAQKAKEEADDKFKAFMEEKFAAAHSGDPFGVLGGGGGGGGMPGFGMGGGGGHGMDMGGGFGGGGGHGMGGDDFGGGMPGGMPGGFGGGFGGMPGGGGAGIMDMLGVKGVGAAMGNSLSMDQLFAEVKRNRIQTAQDAVKKKYNEDGKLDQDGNVVPQMFPGQTEELARKYKSDLEKAARTAKTGANRDAAKRRVPLDEVAKAARTRIKRGFKESKKNRPVDPDRDVLEQATDAAGEQAEATAAMLKRLKKTEENLKELKKDIDGGDDEGDAADKVKTPDAKKEDDQRRRNLLNGSDDAAEAQKAEGARQRIANDSGGAKAPGDKTPMPANIVNPAAAAAKKKKQLEEDQDWALHNLDAIHVERERRKTDKSDPDSKGFLEREALPKETLDENEKHYTDKLEEVTKELEKLKNTLSDVNSTKPGSEAVADSSSPESGPVESSPAESGPATADSGAPASSEITGKLLNTAESSQGVMGNLASAMGEQLSQLNTLTSWLGRLQNNVDGLLQASQRSNNSAKAQSQA